MLKGKNITAETACCVNSCRTRAETMARSLNSRIYPCTWGMTGEGASVDTGMREQEDEEFFDASPSPVEEGGCSRGDDSSAATVAGRVKLFELLQQHAADDATDVFYDVSENVESRDAIGENLEVNSNINYQSNQKIEGYVNDSENSDYKRGETGYINHLEQTDACVIDSKINNQLTEKSASEEVRVNDSFDGEDKKSETSHTNNLEQKDSCVIASENKEDCVYNELLSTVIDKTTMLGLQTSPTCEHLYNSSIDGLVTNQIISVCLHGSVSDVNQTQPIPNKTHFKTSSTAFQSHCSNNDVIEDAHLNIVENVSELNTSGDDLHDKSGTGYVENQSYSDTLKKCSIETDNKPDIPTSIPIQIREEKSSPVQSPTSPKLSDQRRLEVFGEARPVISRSTSLKTGKTPPGTPGRKKIVRFADVFGLDLEDVRHIISGDLPNVPQSAYQDLILPEEDSPESQSCTIELKDRHQGTWETIQAATGPNVLYPTFAIPGQQPDFQERLHTQGICLDSVVISDFNVQCTCRVMNWGFSKKVRARYTVNSWASSNDIEASFVPGSSQHNSDSFTFNIFLPPSCNGVEFALNYKVNGQEYWDNNRGINYKLSCHGNSGTMRASVPNSPTWVHQFW